MNNQPQTSRAIDGKGKTIRELLTAKRYSIDYYQREYKWQKKQIAELLDDLITKFLEHYKEDDDRVAVERYGHYFLGSIIISDKDGQKFIIDGQQRLTTLTLLLIHLHLLLGKSGNQSQLAELIYSQKYGTKSFNLDVPERTSCMEAIFNDEAIDEVGQPESVQNILARYADIEEQFPKELTERPLPFFADWLIENVHLVEITAYSDDDAYTIFETMNDRGLSLSPTDMLKVICLPIFLKRQTGTLRVLFGSHRFKNFKRSEKKKTLTRSSHGFEASMPKAFANVNKVQYLSTSI